MGAKQKLIKSKEEKAAKKLKNVQGTAKKKPQTSADLSNSTKAKDADAGKDQDKPSATPASSKKEAAKKSKVEKQLEKAGLKDVDKKVESRAQKGGSNTIKAEAK